MKNGLKRAAALAITVLMLLTLLPTGLATGNEDNVYSETEIPGLSDGGALLNALQSNAAETWTVTFDIGEAADAAGVVAPESVSVENGATVTDLPAVSWLDAEGNPVQVFAGWYTDTAYTTEFANDTPVTANITVHAKWVNPDDQNRCYVNFFNQAGTTVHLTVSVERGRTVNPAAGPAESGKVFVGWSTQLQGESPISALNAFNFNTPVSQAIAEGNTLNLYAWYGDEVKVSFMANGGLAVPTQIIAAGRTADQPSTTRTGYTFRGWSADPDNYDAFDFDTPIYTDTTLYAFWTADMVPVKLVYMREKANDSGYTPAGKSITVYAPAGSYLSIEEKTISSTRDTLGVNYIDENGAAGRAQSESGRNATIPAVDDTYFQYASATNNRYVMPDGSTVMLVYYDRARVTLTFEYDEYNRSNASIDTSAKISSDDQTKYKVDYSKTRNGFTYTFTAKYEEAITAVWPKIEWVDNASDEFYAWDPAEGNPQSSNMYTLESNLFGADNLKIVNGKLVAEYTLDALFDEVQKYWLIYARTTLPGETVDFTYNGRNYTIYSDACQMAMGNNYYGYKSLEGCTPANSNATFGARYRDLSGSTISGGNRQGSLTVQNNTAQGIFDKVFPNQIDHGSGNRDKGDRCQVLLYDRGTVKLTLHVNDDVYGQQSQEDSYLYGDWIYNEETDLLKTVESRMQKANYIFAGWYTDPDFTDGTQYVPTADSRIEGNMELYAKWEPNQFKAEFYLYVDDANPYKTQGFAEGGKLTDWTVPTEMQDDFIGWYWYVNGRLERFDFASSVGENHVDENGVIKLYAKWNATEGYVSYLPGAGGDNATQEVYDSTTYVINEASVRLKAYNDVWPSGVPADPNLIFVGWKASNGAIYQPGRYVLVTRMLMQFEAQWSKDAVKLVYHANGGVGSDVTETWAKDSVVDIWDNDMSVNQPHFTREGYELIGWAYNAEATTPDFQLGVGTITLSKDTTDLYAVWRRVTRDVTITKRVAGNMYEWDKAFEFVVTSSAAIGLSPDGAYQVSEDKKTAYFTLTPDASVTLKDVPNGATLTVSESNASDYVMTVAPNNGEGAAASYTVPDGEGVVNLTVTNTKNAVPDTGILLDSLPYILILACVVAAGILVFVRRYRNRDDRDD